MREQRWAHLLCGEVEVGEQHMEAMPAAAQQDLEARIEVLEKQVAALSSAVQNLCEQLGMSQPGHTQ
jgi:hypothetical protein